MITAKNEEMKEALEVVRQMGLVKTLRWLYDDYWKARRDRWAEDEYVRDEGIAIGRAEGKAEGKAEYILQLLQNKGEISENLQEKITSEKDGKILDHWFLTAAKVDTVEQFRERENL